VAIALAWMVVAVAARGVLAARLDAVFDHDQAVVAVMAGDIAHGVRWPIFFDGQDYMGAVEAYTAAPFVWLFGPAPAVVAIAPVLYFGLFVAGQFLVWSRWSGRAAGHLAAFLAVVCSPMATYWTFIPRGGYVELMAWAVATLGVYRRVTRDGASPLSPMAQVGWGLLLAGGYFLNPLSLVVYAALAFDWVFIRHAARIREARPGASRLLDSSLGPLVGIGAGALLVLVVGVGYHNEFRFADDGMIQMRSVGLMGLLPAPYDRAAGLILVALAGLTVAWWTGAGMRVVRLLAGHPCFDLGVGLTLLLSIAYKVSARLGGGASVVDDRSTWIRAPWGIGPTLRDGLAGVPTLLGSDVRGIGLSLVDVNGRIPPCTMPWLDQLARGLAGSVALMATVVVASVVWRDRAAWRAVLTLQGGSSVPPTVLMTTVLASAIGLFLVQSSSPYISAIRYLVPAWVALPGLIACGLLAWPRRARAVGLVVLAGSWAASQVDLWASMGGPGPIRAVAEDLDRRGVPAIVAPTHVAIPVVALTSDRVGAMEYRPFWARLADRYAGRFPAGGPVVCVVDTTYRCSDGRDFGDKVRELAEAYPGRVRLDHRVGPFEVWEARLPTGLILEPSGRPLPTRPPAFTIAPEPTRTGSENGPTTREATRTSWRLPPSTGASSAAPGSAGAG
jgi:hypothetical protein